MNYSFKMTFLNAKLSLFATLLALSSAMIVKWYIDPNLPLIVFFIVSFLLYHVFKDLLRCLFKAQIIDLQAKSTDEIVNALSDLNKLLKKK
jgi:hypothetical protein